MSEYFEHTIIYNINARLVSPRSLSIATRKVKMYQVYVQEIFRFFDCIKRERRNLRKKAITFTNT